MALCCRPRAGGDPYAAARRCVGWVEPQARLRASFDALWRNPSSFLRCPPWIDGFRFRSTHPTTRLLHDVELHLGNAASHDAELLGGGLRQVDHAPRHEWAAVVDPDRDGAAAPHVGDADLGAERQCPVRGRQCAWVELLTVRSLLGADVEARQAVAGTLQRLLDASYRRLPVDRHGG